MILANDQFEAWDRAHFLHPFTDHAAHAGGVSGQRIMSRGSGSTIYDRQGTAFIDAFAGLYCVNVGYGQKRIAEAISRQAHELAYAHAYAGQGTEASIMLARMLSERAPAHMNHSYFGFGGSDANETIVKLVWYANNVLGRPQRKKIISRWRGYHGAGIISGSLTGLRPFHEAFDLPLTGILHTESPIYYHRDDRGLSEEEFSQRCADRLEALILAEGADTVAAFIGEPMIAAGGIAPPPRGYWEKIQGVLSKYDIFLICDEVVTGFGRLGKMFGTQVYDLQPDFMTLAKGLTSAYTPLSAVMISDRIWEILAQGSASFGPLGHAWTYSAHPVCAAAAVANLELLDDLDLIANVRSVGRYFLEGLRSAVGSHPRVGDIRGQGLLCALELVEDRDDRDGGHNGGHDGPRFFDSEQKVGVRVAAEILDQGVIVRALHQSDIIGFAPPFCLTEPEADLIIEATRKAIARVCD